ncbi:hypothetical protein [Pseudomonas helleri]
MNTWVSFQSAEQPLLGQFSVSGNKYDIVSANLTELARLLAALEAFADD